MTIAIGGSIALLLNRASQQRSALRHHLREMVTRLARLDRRPRSSVQVVTLMVPHRRGRIRRLLVRDHIIPVSGGRARRPELCTGEILPVVVAVDAQNVAALAFGGVLAEEDRGIGGEFGRPDHVGGGVVTAVDVVVVEEPVR